MPGIPLLYDVQIVSPNSQPASFSMTYRWCSDRTWIKILVCALPDELWLPQIRLTILDQVCVLFVMNSINSALGMLYSYNRLVIHFGECTWDVRTARQPVADPQQRTTMPNSSGPGVRLWFFLSDADSHHMMTVLSASKQAKLGHGLKFLRSSNVSDAAFLQV